MDLTTLKKIVCIGLLAVVYDIDKEQWIGPIHEALIKGPGPNI